MERQLEKQSFTFSPEQRRYDDATTWLAEMLDGQMRTPFEYVFNGQELYARDGSSLMPIFEEALEASKQLPVELSFEQRRRNLELEEYQEMIDMMKGNLGNTMVVVSDFPKELEDAKEDVGGYNVTRQQAMLRVIIKSEDDRLQMYSQSLDKSDRKSLESIFTSLGFEPKPGELLGQRMHLDIHKTEQEFLVDKLTGVYDRALTQLYGGSWYAGRRPKHGQNTYDFACRQKDLIKFYEEADEAGQADSSFMYALAATMQKRYSQSVNTGAVDYPPELVTPRLLIEEMMTASREATRTGTTFSGCGMSIGPAETGAENEMSAQGYGNKSEEDKYGSLKFKCQKGHPNTRPRNKLIPKCKTCGVSVAC